MAPLKLMYITNRQNVAKIAEAAGVDRIFVDMEYIGKSDRQGGMDTVQYHHTPEDVKGIREVLTTAELLVRLNPIHDPGKDALGSVYGSSEEEIEAVIEAGADVLMLPFFKTKEEVERFLKAVDGRKKTMLLVETPESAEILDQILELPGIDEVHIGINDMSLGLKKSFMFQLLADGTVEKLFKICEKHEIPHGFGGIATLNGGLLPSRYVISEHYRLGSSFAILSRSFCDSNKITDEKELKQIFDAGLQELRAYEEKCVECKEKKELTFFEENKRFVIEKVGEIVQEKENGNRA